MRSVQARWGRGRRGVGTGWRSRWSVGRLFPGYTPKLLPEKGDRWGKRAREGEGAGGWVAAAPCVRLGLRRTYRSRRSSRRWGCGTGSRRPRARWSSPAPCQTGRAAAGGEASVQLCADAQAGRDGAMQAAVHVQAAVRARPPPLTSDLGSHTSRKSPSAAAAIKYSGLPQHGPLWAAARHTRRRRRRRCSGCQAVHRAAHPPRPHQSSSPGRPS